MHILVLSPRLTESRRAAFRALTRELGEPRFVASGGPPPDVSECDAIVVDGPQPAQPREHLAAIRAAVERGAPLVAIGGAPVDRDGFWADLLGAVAGPEPPPGEYYARVTEAHSHISDRVTREFAVVDGFMPLIPIGDGKVIVDVSVALRDLAAVVETTRGAGRVVACGLGNTDAALRNPELAQLLGRALRPDLHCCGRKIGVGIVGYGPLGGMGYHHGLGVTATDGLELVAMPPAHHVALTLTLLRAGKHVACEKPLCLTVAEADQIIATASASRRMLTVHQNRRWDSDFVALRRAVGAGLLGEIFNVETFVGGYAHPCRTWHSDTAVSGGAGYDWGSHHVDWVLQLLGGVPRLVQAHGHKRVWHDVTNHDQIRVRMTWSDGREAEFLQSDIAAVRRPKFYVQGTAGTLVGTYRTVMLEAIEPGRGYVATQAHHAEAPAELVLARYESGYGISETRLPPAIEQPFAFHRNLADHLHLGEPLVVTPASVRRVIGVLEAAQRSSTRGGAPVVLEDDGS